MKNSNAYYVTLCNLFRHNNVRGGYVPSIFRVDEEGKQETNMKKVANRCPKIMAGFRELI